MTLPQLHSAKKKGIAIAVVVVLVLIGLLVFHPRLITQPLRRLVHKIPNLEVKREIIAQRKKIDISIGILVGKDPFQLAEPKTIKNPVLTAADVTDVEASFVADPFLVRENDMWYMFFEVMSRRTGQGDIGFAQSEDGFHWKYRKIIVDERFHLSYPLVVNEGNSHFMIPETSEQNEIRLYEAIDFPNRWQYTSTLLKGLPFKDSTLFRYADHWWLFTDTDSQVCGELRLYYADSIKGPWTEHPASPVVEGDCNIARPGGRVFSYQNRLFRAAQDDWPQYGNSVRIFQIDKLTTGEYAEHEMCNQPEIQVGTPVAGLEAPAWRLGGYHQYDPHQLGSDAWIVCIDGLTRQAITRQLSVTVRVPFTKQTVWSGYH